MFLRKEWNTFDRIEETHTVIRYWPCLIPPSNGFSFTLVMSRSPFNLSLRRAKNPIVFPAEGIPNRVVLVSVKRWKIEERNVAFRYLDEPAPNDLAVPDNIVLKQEVLSSRLITNLALVSTNVRSWAPRVNLNSWISPKFRQAITSKLALFKISANRINLHNQLTLKSIPDVDSRPAKTNPTKVD